MAADSGRLPAPVRCLRPRQHRPRRPVRRSRPQQTRQRGPRSRLPPGHHRTRRLCRNSSRGRHRAMRCQSGGHCSRLRPARRRRATARPGLRLRLTGRRRGRPRRVRRASPAMAQPRPRYGRRFRRKRRRRSCNSSNGRRRPSLVARRPRLASNQPFSHHRLQFPRKMAARRPAPAARILHWWRRRSMAHRSSIPGRFRRAVRAPRRNRKTCPCLPCRGPPCVRAIRS